MVEEGGIVNEFERSKHNFIDIKASSSAINQEMLNNLKGF